MEKKKIDKILEKIEAGREYRQMTIRVKAKPEADEEPDDKDDEADDDGEKTPPFGKKDEEEEKSYVVEGYASTFNEPYELYSFDGYTVREQMDPAAFDAADMSDVIMQYDHQGRVFARNSNDTLKISTDKHGLYMEANLGGTEAGRQLYEEIRGGYTTKMSFGFTVDEDKREITENVETNTVDVLRTITKVRKLYDVSAVSLPANDGTAISARNYGDGVIAEIKAERLKSAAIREARAKALATLNKYKKEVQHD